MKYVNIILALFFISCATAKKSSEDINKIQGRWVSVEDRNWKLVFVGNKFADVYGEDESEECNFSISKESCDKSYSTLEASFVELFCKETMCLEITSLTDSTFSYRETSTGRLHKFKKIKESEQSTSIH